MTTAAKTIALLSVVFLVMLCTLTSFAAGPGPDGDSHRFYVDPDKVVDDGPIWAPSYMGVSVLVQMPPVWSFSGTQSNEQMGWSVASAGDVNGDGFDDVIVGAPNYNGGAAQEGRVLVVRGSENGLEDISSWQEEGNSAGAKFGNSVASAGDVNGDGYADVIVGAPGFSNGHDDEGGAWVYLGSGGVGLLTTPDWIEEGDQDSAKFGFSVASAGDVNGDGYDEIIVGSPGWSASSALEDEQVGHVWVYYGSDSGIVGTLPWHFAGSQRFGQFGNSVASAGDVNGDGYADVIIGELGYDTQDSGGRAHVFLGAPNGLEYVPVWIAEGEGTFDNFGRSVASAGDVNGDGYSDVIVSADSSPLGAAYVYYGSNTGLSTNADWFVQGDQVAAQFGWSVAGAGDVDADGFDDVIVGAPSYDNEENNEGRVFLFRGTSGGLETTPDWVLESDEDNALLGVSVSSAGDVNGDCAKDMIMGAPFHGLGGLASGYHGEPTDTDDDGLCDSWELRGIDLDNDNKIDLDLPMLGADPEHKDLFVEVDAMIGRAPTVASMSRVVAAFADAPNELVNNPDDEDGITLHLEMDEKSIPLADWSSDWTGFDAVKRDWFGTAQQRDDHNWAVIRRAKLRVYRYGVFANTVTFGTDVGFGERPGDDFVMLLGEVNGGTEDEQSGVFMHELGHTLSLKHGGDNPNDNHKPNYHSVMNYTWSVPNPLFRKSWLLDYSRSVFPPLNEGSLHEPSGISGHAGHWVEVGPPPARVVQENGPVDWNRDDDDGMDPDAEADVNHISGQASPGDMLAGYADWPNLWYALEGHPNFEEGIHVTTTMGNEITREIIKVMREADADCNGNTVFDHEDVGNCTSIDCNGNGVPDDCDITSGWSQDSNSNSTPDECECAVAAPVNIASLQLARGYLVWTNFEEFDAHDLVRGDLLVLRNSEGDFTLSLTACMENNFALPSMVYADEPASGEAWYFLHRGLNCAGNGSLDSGAPSQVGSRDAGVDSAAVTCPEFDCGNGVMEIGELCDGWNLGCDTCLAHGYSGGILRCSTTCNGYDFSRCE